MSKEKQIEEMADKVTYSSERQRRGECVRRIVEAINYRGENDHEDLWSILYDFEKEINAGYRKQSENVIELPCRVGDTIFVIRNDIIEQETVRGIKIGNCGLLLQVSNGFDDFEYHYDIEIGNKLFFAKVEAEAKMKGGAE